MSLSRAEVTRRWRERNPERYKANYQRHNAKRTHGDGRVRWLAWHQAYQRRQVRLLKLEMIAAYGGRCACCGESTYEFLTLDHIGGGGAAERRAHGRGALCTYRRLKNLNWPKDRYRLLCMNCNLSFGRYGYCPHEALQELVG